ncbi:hypothetical protein ACPV5R_18560 [Vibrio astriarenae]
MNKLSFTDADIIKAANAIHESGRNINGTSLRREMEKGRPEKLMSEYTRLFTEQPLSFVEKSAVKAAKPQSEQLSELSKTVAAMESKIEQQASKFDEIIHLLQPQSNVSIVTNREAASTESETELNEHQKDTTALVPVERKDGVKGLAVHIPFDFEAVRESFKSTFPTRHWDGENKLWCVGSRTKKRLMQWIDSVNESGLIENLLEKNEEELQAAELEALRFELASKAEQVTEKLEEVKAQKATLTTEIAQLKSAQITISKRVAEIESINSENEALEAEKRKLFKQQEDTLRKLININIDELYSAREAMIKHGGLRRGDYNRKMYKDSQQLFVEARDKLLDAGYESEGISELAENNINRAEFGDRDYAGDVSHMQIVTLTEI